MKSFPTKVLLMGLLLTLIAFPALAQSSPVITRDTTPGTSKVRLTTVASGLTRPLLVTNAGDGSGRLFVVEQGGKIRILRDGTLQQTPFLDISSLVSQEATQPTGYTERGLLGLAFSPHFADDGRFFVDYTDLNGNSVVARYHVSADNPDVADPTGAITILMQTQPYGNHNGGNLAFGPDGYLYVGFGDGGSQGDPNGNGQNLGTWLGKILRIDVSGDTYAVPPSNPFVNTAGAKPEIWAYGLRNPWRFTFDRATGDLYIGDVGQDTWEEVDFQPAGFAGGANYGWNIYEATHPYSGAAAPANMILPIAEYNHNVGISIAGGYVYRGSALPDLQGVYFFSDFGTGTIWSAWRDSSMNWHHADFITNSGHTVVSFGQDESGELYLVDYNGQILRFDPAS